MRRTLAPSVILISSLFAVFASSAVAEVPPLCTGSYSQQTLYTDQGRVEAAIVGGGGVLYTSSTDGTETGAVLNAYSRGDAGPSQVTESGPGPGGLAWRGRNLLWGYGNTVTNGSTGDLNPVAGLYSVNIPKQSKSVVSDHLGMANGIAQGKGGAIYASNDFGDKVDRIWKRKSGFFTWNGWSTLASGNGMTVGKNGKYLYVNQSFENPSTIAKVDTTDPSKVFTFYTSPDPAGLIFDGLTRDSDNNLYAAVFGRGEVWKISPDKQACVLATDLSATSNVTISHAKKGFKAGNLYAVGFDGAIVEVKGATSAGFPE